MRESPREHTSRKVGKGAHLRVERLVDVQVHAQAGVGGRVEADRDALGRSRVEGGGTAHEVRPRFDGGREGSPVAGTLGAGQRHADERHELQIDDAAAEAPHLAEGVDATGADVGADVGVAADGSATRFDGNLDGPERPRHDVLGAHAAAGAMPGVDGANQIPGGVDDRLGREGLVEMRVRLGEPAQQQHPPEVVVLRRRAERVVIADAHV